MTPQKSGEPQVKRQPGPPPHQSDITRVTAAPALSDQEMAVLECLRAAAGALTARRIQARVTCDPAVLEQALAGLVGRDLVVRLNTIIPSYSYRRGGASTHDG